MNVHLTKACPARLWPGLLLALTTLCASAASPQRVLILNPFTQDVAPFSSVISAFRTTLARELGEPVDIHEVPLDLARFAEAEGEGSLVTFLEDRIRNRPVDLVVPIGGAGISFAARHRERLFPATPVLVVAADPRTVPPAFLRTNATLVAHQVDLSEMVEDILQLQPQTTNIAVVFGASALERFWVNECRREFQGFTNRVGFMWLNELPLPQVLDRCAHLPPQSFILHVFFLVDVAGVPYEKNESLRGLHEAANAPLFGFFASELGRGPIGGRLYQEVEVGSRGARTAIRILRGESPERIPPQIIEWATPVFDGRELQRWGISESRLPPDSVVKFREPTLWEQHRWRIIAITSTCVVEGVLIILLLSNLRRRRRVERALRESEERLSVAVAAGDVGVWVWNLENNLVWASDHWRQMFGFQPGEALHYESVLKRIHPEDRAAVDATVHRAVDEQAEYKSQYRVVLPDGTQRWIAARGRLDSNGDGRRVRMLGASVDVTVRKQVEDSARDLSGRLLHAQEEDRARLGRELHDDITQRLARLAMDVAQCERSAPESSPAGTLREVREGLVRRREGPLPVSAGHCTVAAVCDRRGISGKALAERPCEWTQSAQCQSRRGRMPVHRTMGIEPFNCVLLAERHHGITEGIRRLLESEFEGVVMVADEMSLIESALRLHPSVVVADLALAPGESFGWLRRLLARCPDARVIVVSTHDESSVMRTAFEAGAAGFVFKRALASQLLDAVDAILTGRRYAPPGHEDAGCPIDPGGPRGN